MSETTEPNSASEVQPPAEAPEKTDAMRIELLEAKNRELIQEKQSAQKRLKDIEGQMADLQSNQQQAKQAQLAEAGEFQVLWKQASETVTSLQGEIAELKQQLESKEADFRQQQIKATALNAFSQQGVNAPDHLWKLIGEDLRLDENGSVVALSGGVQVQLADHVNSLKNPGSGYEIYFSGTQSRGMSAAGSTTQASGTKSWSSMSAFERMAVESADELNGTNNAARLKAAG